LGTNDHAFECLRPYSVVYWEAGWWDGALALRDYFVAQGEEGACYWIYRERDAGHARWFLHGLFA
jgi:protein ImuB